MTGVKVSITDPLTIRPIVISYTNSPNYWGTKRFLASLEKWGWEYSLVTEPQWKGFGNRLRKVVNQCEIFKGHHTHCVHVDAHDVIASGPPSEFIAPDCPLQLAVEGGCWPDGNREKDYPQPRTQLWWYGHSQYVVDLNRLDVLKAEDVEDYDDDQRHCTNLYFDNPAEVKLDYSCKTIQSIAFAHPWTDYFEYQGDRIVNKITGSKPLFLHANGGTATDWWRE